MAIDFRLLLPPFTSDQIEVLSALSAIAFGQIDHEYVAWRISHMPDVSAFCAMDARRMVGFKVGYAIAQRKYYSWLGGVHPEHRRRGIATQLTARQHSWLVDRGYSTIETATNQENHSMVQANLKQGFSVSGIRTEPARTQLLFHKALG
jgi:GNAT superfamily N-acetyltransferase